METDADTAAAMALALLAVFYLYYAYRREQSLPIVAGSIAMLLSVIISVVVTWKTIAAIIANLSGG